MPGFYKHPFTVRDASNKHILRAMEATADLFYKTNRALGPIGDALLLEDFGQSLIQLSWRDETGFYMTFRIAPLDSRRENVRKAAEAIQDQWRALFKNVHNYQHQHDAETGRFTVAVFTDSTSIGD